MTSTASPPAASAPTASAQPVNVYANIAPGLVNPAWAHDPVRVYVPNSLSNTVSEIDPRSHRVIAPHQIAQRHNGRRPYANGISDSSGPRRGW